MSTHARIAGPVALVVAVLAAGALLGSCGKEPHLAPPSSDSTRVTLQVAGTTVDAELALTGERRRRGLMDRTELGPDQGMLFLFPEVRPQKFWMKNTLIPLDIVFIGEDGAVLNIHEAPPGVEQPGFPSHGPCRVVLELNQGWSAEHGLEPGDRVAIPPELFERVAP